MFCGEELDFLMEKRERGGGSKTYGTELTLETVDSVSSTGPSPKIPSTPWNP